MTFRSSCGWFDHDALSEAFGLVDEAADLAFGVAALVVVAPEVVVGLAGGEHVPVGDQDRVLDGADGAAVSDAGPQSSVLGLEVAAGGAAARGRGGGAGGSRWGGRGPAAAFPRGAHPSHLLPLRRRPERRVPADW